MVLVAQNDRKYYDVPVRLWTMQISKMELIISAEPMDPVDMDFVKLEVTVDVKDKPVVKKVLMVVDHFT